MRCDWCHKPGADVVKLLDAVPVKACGRDHAEMVAMGGLRRVDTAPDYALRCISNEATGGSGEPATYASKRIDNGYASVLLLWHSGRYSRSHYTTSHATEATTIS